jgi:hypothetical protein
MTVSIGARALRRGRNAIVALLVVLLAVGDGGLVAPADRASAASAVTVSAVNALTGAPVANVGLSALPTAGGPPVGATTGGDGRALFSLPAGQYGFGPSQTPSAQWVRRSFRPPVTATLDGVNPPPPLTVEIVPVAVTGTVTDPGGAPMPDANVVLLGQDRFPLGDARTGVDGAFRLGGATKSDSYFVVANPPEWSTTLSPSEPRPVSVSVANGQIAGPTDAGAIALPTATKFAHITLQAPGMPIGPVMVNAFRVGQSSQLGFGKRVEFPASPAGFRVPLRPGAWNIGVVPTADNSSAGWIAPPPKSLASHSPTA